MFDITLIFMLGAARERDVDTPTPTITRNIMRATPTAHFWAWVQLFRGVGVSGSWEIGGRIANGEPQDWQNLAVSGFRYPHLEQLCTH
jgi:hypothetical protein